MKLRNLLLTALATVLILPTASGQIYDGMMDASHPIVGVGTAELKRPANAMVALFSMKATGTNIREATASLHQVTADARAKIVELGAKEDSIRVAVIGLHQETEDANQRMMIQMRGSMGGRRSVPDESESEGEAAESEIVTVATTIRATWALDSSSPEEALASSWELQKAIQKAEVIPTVIQAGLSPEDQEVLEESRMFSDSGEDENSNEPVFLYLNVVTHEERTQLLKEAFTKAEKDARETAEITNASLGSVLNIRISSEVPGNEYAQYAYQMGNREEVGALIAQLKADNPLAMMGLAPSELDYQIVVRAGFGLAALK